MSNKKKRQVTWLSQKKKIGYMAEHYGYKLTLRYGDNEYTVHLAIASRLNFSTKTAITSSDIQARGLKEEWK